MALFFLHTKKEPSAEPFPVIAMYTVYGEVPGFFSGNYYEAIATPSFINTKYLVPPGADYEFGAIKEKASVVSLEPYKLYAKKSIHAGVDYSLSIMDPNAKYLLDPQRVGKARRFAFNLNDHTFYNDMEDKYIRLAWFGGNNTKRVGDHVGGHNIYYKHFGDYYQGDDTKGQRQTPPSDEIDMYFVNGASLDPLIFKVFQDPSIEYLGDLVGIKFCFCIVIRDMSISQ